MFIDNLLYIILFVLLIAAVAVIAETLSLKGYVPKEYARKIFHFMASLTGALAVLVVQDISLLRLGTFCMLIFAFLAVKFDWFSTIDERNYKSWGIPLFALSFLLLLLFLPGDRQLIFTVILILGVSDAVAAVTGYSFPKGIYNLTGSRKTVTGSIAFFLSCMILLLSLFIVTDYFQELSFSYFIFTSIIISFLLMVVEGISSYGSDNFFIPLFAAILFQLFLVHQNSDLLVNFYVGMILALAVAWASYRVKFLTLSGSVATFLLAGFIFGLGGWKWSVPIMSFFILSSLLSKFRKKKNAVVEMYFEKTGVRDHWQVAANGGIGGVLVIINMFYPSEVNYMAYLASLAAVCADTWATEIGTLRKTATYNILTFKPIEQGVSGGVSFVGTTGAFLGAFVIYLSGVYWLDGNLFSAFVLVVFAGLAGSFFDSVLGATIQAQNKCTVCDKITEREVHCGEKTQRFKGLDWLNNDLVNLFASIFGIVILLIFVGFYV